ncbi:aldehyde dehydrogenase family protein, partial [Candidatus Parcubacteria bacterium]
MNSVPQVPKPKNEPVLDYLDGRHEKWDLKRSLEKMRRDFQEITSVINGEKVGPRSKKNYCIVPHCHQHKLAEYYCAEKDDVLAAIKAAIKAKLVWENMSWYDRAAIFLRAAEMLSKGWRPTLNAATMLGQSKTVFQAEIDSACELIDFWRFNAFYAQQIFAQQPESAPGIWNRLEYRPLEGFVFAVTPFNFTSIAGNLPTAPALMGNTVVWKPASTAVYSAYFLMELLREAGLPPGVINMVLGSGKEIGEVVLKHPQLAGVHFTGSTETFRSIWRTVGANIERYRTYPRLVGETGGKDFVVAHPSADVDALAVALVRGAFEYQGQKCSAASRAYIPQCLWKKTRDRVLNMVANIKMGPVEDFSV